MRGRIFGAGFFFTMLGGLLLASGAGVGCSCQRTPSSQPQSGPNIADGLRLELQVEPGTEREPIRRRHLQLIYSNVSDRPLDLDGRQIWGRLRIVDAEGREVPIAPPPPFTLWHEKFRIRLAPGKKHTVRVELALETIDKLDGPWYFVTSTFEVDATRLPPNTGLWTGRVTSNRIRLAPN